MPEYFPSPTDDAQYSDAVADSATRKVNAKDYVALTDVELNHWAKYDSAGALMYARHRDKARAERAAAVPGPARVARAAAVPKPARAAAPGVTPKSPVSIALLAEITKEERAATAASVERVRTQLASLESRLMGLEKPEAARLAAVQSQIDALKRDVRELRELRTKTVFIKTEVAQGESELTPRVEALEARLAAGERT